MTVSDKPQTTSMRMLQRRRTLSSYFTERGEGLGTDYAYADEISQHYTRLENFSLKSKSVAVRDAFALSGTNRVLKFEDLKAFIGTNAGGINQDLRQQLRKSWKSGALLALSRLLANQRAAPADLENAYRFFALIDSVWGLAKFTEKDQLIYVETLGELGFYEEQENLIKRLGLQKKYPVQVELNRLNAILAKSVPLSKRWVSKLNALYTRYGHAPVRVMGDKGLTALDRLRTENKGQLRGPLVSVLMPTYQPDESMLYSVASLLNQSWSNIEIIIVDDQSDREFDKYLEAAALLSDKVQVVRNARNLGSYSARNNGLRFASGEFVTVLDDDDWAHGDKIATQVRHLINNTNVVANLSLHGRVTEDLRFVRLNNNMFLSHTNYSSLMVRRRVIDEIGGWDSVNRGGDSEYISRINSFYGSKPVLIGDVPLSLSRTREGSLTSGELVRGYMDSSRVLYANAFKQWHLNAAKIDPKLLAPPAPHSYPVPATMGAGRRRANLGVFDVVFMTDFRMDPNVVGEVLTGIHLAHSRGYRVGYIHAEAPYARVPSKISPALFDLQQQGLVNQIGWSDTAEIKLLVVRHHSVATYLDRMEAKATVHRALIVAGTIPRIFGGADFANDIGRAQVNIDRMFDVESLVLADSEVGVTARDLFVDSSRRVQSRWTALGSRSFISAMDQGKTARGATPVLGRHGSEHASQWPDNYEKFSEVYLPQGVKTRFPKRDRKYLLKKYPELEGEQVQFYQTPQGNEASGYLTRIDFWVYFPHENTLFLDKRLIVEAMLHQKMIVLPYRFAGMYGPGPLYVKVSEIARAVHTVWRDKEEWSRRIHDNLAYVAAENENFLDLIAAHL